MAGVRVQMSGCRIGAYVPETLPSVLVPFSGPRKPRRLRVSSRTQSVLFTKRKSGF